MDELNPYAPPAAEVRDIGLVFLFEMDEPRYFAALTARRSAGAGFVLTLLAGFALLFAGYALVMLVQRGPISILGVVLLCLAPIAAIGPFWIRHHRFVLPAARRDLAAALRDHAPAWGTWRVEVGPYGLRLTTPGSDLVWARAAVEQLPVQIQEHALPLAFLLQAGDFLLPIPSAAINDVQRKEMSRWLRG